MNDRVKVFKKIGSPGVVMNSRKNRQGLRRICYCFGVLLADSGELGG